jgi:hypothetical protein
MQTKQIAANTGSSIAADPIASVKALFFILIAILIIYVMYRVIKGVSSIGDAIGSIGGTSEQDKQEIFSNNDFSQAQAYLDPTVGITDLIRAKYKNASEYQLKKRITDTLLNGAAEQIFESKTGPYANTAEIQSAIASLPSRASVSLMALRFNTVYGKYADNLKTFINKHLNVKEVQTLNNIILKKPTL